MLNPKINNFSEQIKEGNHKIFNQLFAFIGSKLFFNFFSWFCTTTIVIFCIASAYSYFYHYKPAQEELISIATEILQENGQIMVEAYENNGAEGLERFRGPGTTRLYDENLKDLFYQNGASAQVKEILSAPNGTLSQSYDNNGYAHTKNLTAQKIENNLFPKNTIKKDPLREDAKHFFRHSKKEVEDFVKTLFTQKGTSILTIKDENIVGCQFISEKGNQYVSLIYVPKRMPGIKSGYSILKKTTQMLPLFIIFCAVLCYCMARYVAKPIFELQIASRKFAEGDFSKKIPEKYKQRNDELGELATDFSDMAEKIESGIKSQKRLFNDISHELRSPLARMKIAIELLQMKVEKNEKPLVLRIEKDVERMNVLISELLQFSKLENKEIGRAFEEINLADSLKEVCNNAAFEGKTTKKGVKLTIKRNCIIKGVGALVERACENVVRNALRFTPENTSVEITLDKIDKDAVITITDKGPGVPENEINKIFAPFYCVEQDRNPQKGGIGLGLSIALRAVKLHNGSIDATNKDKGGLTVTIRLPLA